MLGFGVCGFAIPRKLLPPAPKIQRGPWRVGFEVSDAGVGSTGSITTHTHAEVNVT